MSTSDRPETAHADASNQWWSALRRSVSSSRSLGVFKRWLPTALRSQAWCC
jgi:hypothetical protein